MHRVIHIGNEVPETFRLCTVVGQHVGVPWEVSEIQIWFERKNTIVQNLVRYPTSLVLLPFRKPYCRTASRTLCTEHRVFQELLKGQRPIISVSRPPRLTRFTTSSSTTTATRTISPPSVSMAQPSSSHRDRERSAHHHHRTISSTTLLLVLSLILAVLAVMLSLPSSQGVANPEGSTSGVWGYLSPKRSQVLVAREHAVAVREADVARREADILAGTPGGVTPLSCPPVPSPSVPPASPQIYVEAPVQTVIKEVVKEVEAIGPPSWWKDAGIRVEELLEREARISEREKDVGRREENIGRRETDASRRETWIMEQLMFVEQSA